jgi:hypothetical protein
MRYLRRFGAFLSDFLVGDAWELFVGPLVALAVAWALLQFGIDATLAGVAFVVTVVLVIGAHLTVALRGSA